MWRNRNNWTPPSLRLWKLFDQKYGDLAGCSPTLSISRHIPDIDLPPLDIVFNKPPPSILLHAKGNTTRKVLLSSRSQTWQYFQSRSAHIPPWTWRTAILDPSSSPLCALFEYQRVIHYLMPLGLLERFSHHSSWLNSLHLIPIWHHLMSNAFPYTYFLLQYILQTVEKTPQKYNHWKWDRSTTVQRVDEAVGSGIEVQR